MENYSLILTIFLIFAGAAVFSTLALYTKQSLMVAYMFFGILFRTWGPKEVSDIMLITRVDDIGSIFLMFLLGTHLRPQDLLRIFSKIVWVTFASSSIFFAMGFGISYLYGYGLIESLIIGSCMMFSSTIAGIKLLPPSNQ